MWQPPRVTSTTVLQLDHLVSLDATLWYNRTRIALSHNRMITIKHMWDGGLLSTLKHGHKVPQGALQLSWLRPPSIYSPHENRAVVPFHWALLGMTGRAGRIDQTHTVQCPINRCTPCIASVQPQSLDLNGRLSRANDQVMTGRSTTPRTDAAPPESGHF
jgi:hypothetical protein